MLSGSERSTVTAFVGIVLFGGLNGVAFAPALGSLPAALRARRPVATATVPDGPQGPCP